MTDRRANRLHFSIPLALAWASLGAGSVHAQPSSAPDPSPPLASYELPPEWKAAYWATPAAKALAALDPKAIAALVPEQAGFRFCRCPACEAPEADDPLAIWSPEEPTVIACRACGAKFPNDEYPAKAGDPAKVPEETIEVLPGVVHKYPYHVPSEPAYVEERLYLDARRDDQARADLAKFALYAVARHRDDPGSEGSARLGTLAAAVVLRFAQVYPAYATHLDQPGTPKQLQQADLGPPYRRDYRTAKWGWTAATNVPLSLAIAHAIVRDRPALAEAARALEVGDPARRIERDLFRASARFVADQPEEYGEDALLAARGLLLAARLLADPRLEAEATARLDRFGSRGFYHDGTWHEAEPGAQARVVAMLDDDLGRLAAATPPVRDGRGLPPGLAVLELARALGGGAIPPGVEPGGTVLRASWPAPDGPGPTPRAPAGPRLQGGAGIARLEVGEGAGALGIDLLGVGEFGEAHARRLGLRVDVGAVPVLGDLDALGPTPSGFERASASHDTLLIDGINQRESYNRLLIPAPGADVLFYAADPDFQVVTFDDRLAYPSSADRYRRTVVASEGPAGTRYAVSIFEATGGGEHDLLFHAAPGVSASWRTSAPLLVGPETLLPASIPFLKDADPEGGRWFVQALGEFEALRSAVLERPSQAILAEGDSPGVRLHLLGDLPAAAVVATTPNGVGSTGDRGGAGEPPRRSSLLLRRRSRGDAPLASTFVTVIEPVVPTVPLLGKVGRVDAEDGVVVLVLEAGGVVEHLVFNPTPGTPIAAKLADGRMVETDGLVVRVVADRPILAGGTFAEVGGLRVEQERAGGKVRATGSAGPMSPGALGWIGIDASLPDPEALVGRSLSIRHGNGISRGWTVVKAVNLPRGGARIDVRELAGFRIDPETGDAVYEQFPGLRAPGPHTLSIHRIAR